MTPTPETAGAEKTPYHLTEQGRATRRAYRLKHHHQLLERLKRNRKEYAKKNPERIRARHLLGQAVRLGHLPMPPNEVTRSWNNRWSFHHPDYSRPYYGCWLRNPDHRLVDRGKMPCPPCTDYEPQVRAGVLKAWGLDRSPDLAALRAVGP